MENIKILVVDDESRMRKLVRDFLTREGYTVLEAGDGMEAMDVFYEDKDIALIILDIMMPKMDGWQVCREIRESSKVPIIMLTARSEERDELQGFELGVDEYISKPFSPKILVARVNAILRRTLGTDGGDVISAGGITIDKAAHIVKIDGAPVDLSFKEFELLAYFVENQGIALSREKILNNVWNYDYFGDAAADEDTLFRDIHKHILHQTKSGGRIDTETELAERFHVTRYKVRKALSILSQMGIVDRAPKRGMTVNSLGPKNLSSQIQVQMDIANFDIREFIEARLLIEVEIIPLAIRRMTPALLGRLEDAINRIEMSASNTEEADRWDREFHLLLLEACGNRVLQVFSAALVTYFEKTTAHLPQNDPDFVLDMARKERELLGAIKRGEAERAKSLLSMQLREQVDLLPT